MDIKNCDFLRVSNPNSQKASIVKNLYKELLY